MKLIFLIILNCFKSLEKIRFKYPINANILNSIKQAKDNEIESFFKSNNNGMVLKTDNDIMITDLNIDSKNFLMILLEDYGKEYIGDQDILKMKVEIFKKYIPYFKNNINDTDSGGMTLLFYSINTDLIEAVKTVLDITEVDIWHLDKDSISPINYCILNKPNILKQLSRKVDKNSLCYLSKFKLYKDNPGSNPLVTATLERKVDIVKILLKNGSFVNAANENEIKAIWLSAHYGSQDIVEELLAKGAKHLGMKEIILKGIGKTIGIIFKSLIESSINAGIAIAKTHAPIPIGPVELKSLLNKKTENLEIDKEKCYKKVRDIYKRGKWITKVEKINVNKEIIIEYFVLLSNILKRIDRKYIELKRINSTFSENETKIKILAMNKFEETDRISSDTFIRNMIVELDKIILDCKNESYKKQIEDFKNKLINKKSQIKQFGLNIINEFKDESLAEYLTSEDITSLRQIESKIQDTIESFKNIFPNKNIKDDKDIDSYEKLCNYIENIYKNKTKIKEAILSAGRFLKKAKDIPKKIKTNEKVSKIHLLIEGSKTNYSIGSSKKFKKKENQEMKELEKEKDIIYNEEKLEDFITNYSALIAYEEKLEDFLNRLK